MCSRSVKWLPLRPQDTLVRVNFGKVESLDMKMAQNGL
jgi:hypothetical protein